VILYQLLSGNLPFVGDDMPNTVVKVIMEEPVPLARLRPDVPQALLAVVDRCLRKSRDERFPHIAAFAAALQDVANATGRAAIEKILRVSQHAGQAPPSAPLLPLTQQPAVKELASPPGFLGAGTTNGEAVSVMAGSDATTAILPKRSVTPLVIAGVAVVIGLLGGIAAYALNSGGPTVTTASGSNEATTEKKKAEPAPSAEAAQATASMAASPSSAPTTSASPSTPSTAPKPTAPAGLAITVPPGTSKSDPKAKASSTPSATPPPPPVVTELTPPVVTPPPAPPKPAKNTNVYEE
jgi:serine/threonine-protein kinase